MSLLHSGEKHNSKCLAERTQSVKVSCPFPYMYVNEKVAVRSGIRTHVSGGECDIQHFTMLENDGQSNPRLQHSSTNRLRPAPTFDQSRRRNVGRSRAKPRRFAVTFVVSEAEFEASDRQQKSDSKWNGEYLYIYHPAVHITTLYRKVISPVVLNYMTDIHVTNEWLGLFDNVSLWMILKQNISTKSFKFTYINKHSLGLLYEYVFLSSPLLDTSFANLNLPLKPIHKTNSGVFHVTV